MNTLTAIVGAVALLLTEPAPQDPITLEPPTTYTIIAVAEYSTPFKLNNNKEVVGGWEDIDGWQKPFYWADGQLTILPTLGGIFGVARGINESGQVVGYSTTDPNAENDHEVIGFLWDNETMTPLTPIMYSRSYAWAINDDGLIVGDLLDNAGRRIAFKYYGQMETLPLWTAKGVTWDGRIIGGYQEYRTFVTLHPDDAITDEVPGVWSVQDVNSNGWFVGDSEDRAFIWKGSGEKIILDEAHSSAYGINDSGQAVGSKNGRAMLWENGESYYLDTVVEVAGASFNAARDINDYGEIVVEGYVPGYQETSFILLPPSPPEPFVSQPEPVVASSFAAAETEPTRIILPRSDPNIPTTPIKRDITSRPIVNGSSEGGCFIESTWR